MKKNLITFLWVVTIALGAAVTALAGNDLRSEGNNLRARSLRATGFYERNVRDTERFPDASKSSVRVAREQNQNRAYRSKIDRRIARVGFARELDRRPEETNTLAIARWSIFDKWFWPKIRPYTVGISKERLDRYDRRERNLRRVYA